MKRYEVTVTTFGYKSFYWEKGQIVELADDERPPEYFFRLISEDAPKVEAVPSVSKKVSRPKKKVITEG